MATAPYFILKLLDAGTATALFESGAILSGPNPTPTLQLVGAQPFPDINGSLALENNDCIWSVSDTLASQPDGAGQIAAQGFTNQGFPSDVSGAIAQAMGTVQFTITCAGSVSDSHIFGPGLCGAFMELTNVDTITAGTTWGVGPMAFDGDSPLIKALSTPGTVLTDFGLLACIASPDSHIVNSTTVDTRGTVQNSDTLTPGTPLSFISGFDCGAGTGRAGQDASVGPPPGVVLEGGGGALYAAIFEIQMPVYTIGIGSGVSFPGTGPTGAMSGLPTPPPGPLPVSLPAMPCLTLCTKIPI